ncbi:MAG: thioredoxin-dependent thiol peroxidase [Candidatus Caenarcaniphilales bacterium]|nr:thioredoxin-dependent thiol peroxidase [Candidatus Caenarcaniphilales bacterium]
MSTTKKQSDWLGKTAPDFKVKDQDGNDKSLSDYAGKYLLLYFYPKDLTPGCTTEACNFRDSKADLDSLDLEIVGVSCDPIDKHNKFIEKYDLNFTLLADTEKEIVEKYGVWVEKSMYGKKYMGIQRDSFLINKEGKIIKHYIKVKPKDHVAEVIKDLQNISELDG